MFFKAQKTKHCSALLLFFLFFYVPTIFAVSPSIQQLIPVGHWVYDAITALALENGETTLANNAPLSIAEFKLHLNSIDYNSLSDAGKFTYNKIIGYFDNKYPAFKVGIISLGTDIAIVPEMRYKSNEKIDWIRPYSQSKKLLELPIILDIGDYAAIRSNITFGQTYWAYKGNIPVNIPLELSNDQVDLQFPFSSYLSTGAAIKNEPFMNFQLGVNQLEVGKTQTGSVIISDSLYAPSYAQLSFFSTHIRYAITPIQLNVDKYLYLHRLEFRPLKRLSIGILEGVLISKPLELRFLNPAAIFHSLFSWHDYGSNDSDSSPYLGITFDYNPWKFMRLYGLIVMNQFQTPSELSSGGTNIPNGLGFQGGFETWIPHKSGFFFAGIEGLYTYPWLYVAAKDSPSFYKTVMFMPKTDKESLVPFWTGTPFGPDTIAGQLKLGYTVFSHWSAFFTYRLKIQGVNNLSNVSNKNFYYPNDKNIIHLPQNGAQNDVTPSGLAEYEHMFLIQGSWALYQWLEINAHAGYIFTLNRKNVLQNEQGTEIAFSVRFKPVVLFTNTVKKEKKIND